MGLGVAFSVGGVLNGGMPYSGGYTTPLSEPVSEVYYDDLFFAPSGGIQKSKLSTHVSGLISEPYKVNSKHQLLIQNVIENVCDVFALSKGSLAELCDVTRKTVYNWIDKPDTLRSHSARRLFELNVAAIDWKQSGFKLDKVQLKAPVLGRESILSILNESPLNKERLLFAGSRLNILSLTSDKISDPFA
jgi:hypothetical protein